MNKEQIWARVKRKENKIRNDDAGCDCCKQIEGFLAELRKLCDAKSLILYGSFENPSVNHRGVAALKSHGRQAHFLCAAGYFFCYF